MNSKYGVVFVSSSLIIILCLIFPIFPPPTTCRLCSARLFSHESRTMCCKGRKAFFEQIRAPQEFIQLFSNSSTDGIHFRQHIKSYIYIFSFISIGVHVDENILSIGRCIYTFRAQGAFYHKIVGFYPI